MTLLLGIDTGGTFTDAVLVETNGHPSDNSGYTIIAKAKALTTRHDLAIGIAGAAEAVLRQSNVDPKMIGLVSLSTTLATNALVEGQGGRVALISIGFAERDLKNAGLAEAVGNDPIVHLAGGHNTHGGQAAPLDLTTLEDQLEELAERVSGFAVAGYFAVRNPAHELAVRDLILQKTGRAVTCSHELSARLNGPKRALTTVLNARLVPMITRLIEATRETLTKYQITAPVMVVRGDGALVSAEFAMRRPIETILSGPAASLVGARFLTGEQNAFVNDIGGTTSDIAQLIDGAPSLDPDGAMVGGYRTMVEAVAMHTFGLGGDSEITLGGTALHPELVLGPKRLVPLSLIANQHAEIVQTALDKQLKSTLFSRYDGRFAMLSGAGLATGLSINQQRLFDKITAVPQSLENLLDGMVQAAALKELVSSGLVLMAGLTPTDAMQINQSDAIYKNRASDQNHWDADAALKGLKLFGRQRDGGGNAYCSDPAELASRIIKRVERRSAEVVLETSFRMEGKNGAELVQHPLIADILNKREQPQPDEDHDSLVGIELSLSRPVIGLGASAHQYHPNAAHLLGTTALIPDHADVANAIGAVVGQVAIRTEITLSQPVEGRYQVTGIEAPFMDEHSAFAAAESLVHSNALKLVREAGATEVDVVIERHEKRAEIESRSMLVEATLVATASGRPPIVAL